MSSRRNLPSPYKERASEMTRRGSLASEPMESLEQKLASQAAQIKSLAGDNHKLATMHLALRRNLVAEQDEAQKLRDHITSTRTEGDIQIRILLDKMAKMEADIRAGEGLKKEVQEAHREAQDLVASLSELTTQIQQGTSDLDNARADIKKLPDMRAELDNLRQEHERLHETFEHEKGVNSEKVEQLKILEKNLVAMSEEVERLRTELSDAEKRATAPIPQMVAAPIPQMDAAPIPQMVAAPIPQMDAAPIPQVNPYVSSANVYPSHFHANGYANGFNEPYHHHMVGGVGPEGQYFYPGGEYPPGAPPVMDGPMGYGFGYTVGGPPVMNGATAGGYPAGPPMMNGQLPMMNGPTAGGYPAGPPMMNGQLPMMSGPTAGGYPAGPPMMNGPPPPMMNDPNGVAYPVGPPTMNGPPPPMMNDPNGVAYPVGPPTMNGPVVDGYGFGPGDLAWGIVQPPYDGLHRQG